MREAYGLHFGSRCAVCVSHWSCAGVLARRQLYTYVLSSFLVQSDVQDLGSKIIGGGKEGVGKGTPLQQSQ